MKRKSKTFVVRLSLPTSMWALVEVKATCPEDAVKQAFELNERGEIDYEQTAPDHLDAELVAVDEL